MLTVMSTLTNPDIGKNNVVYDSLMNAMVIRVNGPLTYADVQMSLETKSCGRQEKNLVRSL